jgi:hypothetical protein
MKFAVGIIFLSILLTLPKFALGQSTVCDPYKDYDCLLDSISSVVDNWANAWVEHDIDRYLDAYAENTSPLDNVDYKQWKNSRVARVTQIRDIKVNITMIEIKPLSENNIGVQFIQQYASQGYSDNVIKQLVINADFKIVKERIVSKISAAEAAEMISWINNK